MTAKQLFDILEQAIHDGHGDASVYFDTEGKNYDYHMAKIGSAYDISERMTRFMGEKKHMISLHEEQV